MKLKTIFGSFAVICAATFGACDTGRTSHRLPVIRTASLLAPQSGTGAILVLDPGECLSCDVGIADWIALQRNTKASIWFVFTREPTMQEHQLLLPLRLNIAGVLENSAEKHLVGGSGILYFVNRKMLPEFSGGGTIPRRNVLNLLQKTFK